MSIATEISRIQQAKADIKSSIEAKGVTVPSAALIDDYSDYVDAIQTGGGGGTPIAESVDVSDYTGGTSFDIKKQITGVNFPNGVTSIANSSFENMSGITSVTIPSGVTSIGDRVFYGCSGLTSVTIPNSVTSIGSYVFDGCSSLTSLTIPSSVTNIGMYFIEDSNVSSIMISDLTAWCNITKNYPFGKTYHLYLNGSEITNLVIPNTLTTIKKYCFNQCISLTSITIPSSVTSIGNYAFQYCSGLTSITIPNNVTSIGDHAFYSTSINTIITENISNYCLITTGDMWISSSYDLYEGNTLVQNITIPNTVTEIPSRKFYKCTSLQSVTIPDTVTKINPYAFSGCSNLSSVTCLATTPPSMVSWYTYFDGTDANLVIYVPAASVDTYKAASGWSSYADSIQAIPTE